MTRTVLFDIDQTLLYSGGAGGLAMRRAFHKLYGVEDGFRRIEFSGRTDWGILRDAMRQQGLLDGQPEDYYLREMARFQDAYLGLLPGTLREVDGGRVMPGVTDLLEVLSARDDVRLGLATGNFRRAACIKLAHFRLDTHLAEGGFGDDSEDRAEVVALAIDRVAGDSGRTSVWVIGDTPLDVEAAQANGARALGVGTGPCSSEELTQHGADTAVPDLSDTDAVVGILLG